MRVLQGIADKPLRALARRLETRTLLRGHALYQQGGSWDSMAIVIDGRLSVEAEIHDERVRVGAVYPGEAVAANSLLLPAPRDATALADVLTSITILSRRAFLELEKEHQDLSIGVRRGILGELMRRLREADARIDGALKRRGAQDDVWPDQPPPPGPPRRTALKMTAVPAFARFDKDDLRALVAMAPPQGVNPGTELVRQGEQRPVCHVLLRGTVDLVRKVGTRTRFVARMTDGAIIGQQSLVDETPRSATAVVTQRSAIMTLHRDQLEEAVDRREPFAVRFMEQLTMSGIKQYRAAHRRLLHLLGGDPRWQEAGEETYKSRREEAREAAADVIQKATTTREVNSAMLQHLRVATNEWGLDLDFDR